jgi:hypothetical protein
MHESAMLERSRLRPFLFNLPPTLMLLFATVAAIMGRYSEPPAQELAKAEAAARAYLHSDNPQMLTHIPDVGGATPSPERVRYLASGADLASGSDEPAMPELFGTNSDVSCDDLGTVASGYQGQLMWYYKDIVGKEHGPYPESLMRDWWCRGEFETNALTGPNLPVKLKTWDYYLKLKTIYDLGVPPTWQPTTVLTELAAHRGAHPPNGEESTARRSPLPEAATNPKPEPDPRATRAEGIDIGTSASGPVWVDTLAGNAVVTEAERVAAEQGSEDGNPFRRVWRKTSMMKASQTMERLMMMFLRRRRRCQSRRPRLKLVLPTELLRIH